MASNGGGGDGRVDLKSSNISDSVVVVDKDESRGM